MKVAEASLGKKTLSPLYVTTTVLSPTVNPGTITLNSPSTTPTVAVYSVPICMVTLPVAFVITVIFTAATSPTVIFATLTVTEDASLFTLNIS